MFKLCNDKSNYSVRGKSNFVKNKLLKKYCTAMFRLPSSQFMEVPVDIDHRIVVVVQQSVSSSKDPDNYAEETSVDQRSIQTPFGNLHTRGAVTSQRRRRLSCPKSCSSAKFYNLNGTI